MQALLLIFFVLLALALGSVLGLDLLGTVPSPLEAVFGLFKQRSVAIALAGSILVFAMVAGVIFAWQSWQRRRPISALIRWLEQKVPNSDAFAANLEDFANQIPAVHAPLGHAWEEFDKTLIRPDPSRAADGGTVRNTERPSTYFNVQAMVEAGFHLPFWLALPNYFVGFGLLCTFLGLVSGLYFAAKGVASPDANEARNSLQGLLNAATFKFLTSIAGVLASLGLSVFVRSQTQALQGVLDRLCRTLEKRLLFVTPESLAQKQLKEQEKLTASMERFNTDFAVQLAEAVETRMNPALANVVDAIGGLAETFKGNADKTGKDVSDTVVSELSGPLKILTDAMKELTDASHGAVERVNEFSNTYSQKMESVTERFEAGITTAAEKIKNAAMAAGDAFRDGVTTGGNEAGGKIDEAGKRMHTALTPLVDNITSLNDTLSKVQGTFKDYDARVQSMKQGVDDSTRALGEVTQGFQSTATALAASAKPVRDAAAALIATTSTSREASRILELALQDVRTLVAEIAATQTKLGTAWEQYRERFDTTDEKLAATFLTLQKGIGQTEKQVQDFVLELDKHFSTAVNTLGGAVQDLVETAEELSNALPR